MTYKEAGNFLAATGIDSSGPAVWADLGCGDGLFSQVLSSRLHNGSTIYAVDKAKQSPIVSMNPEVKIAFRQADFIKDDLPLENISGILMANALHYVEDKPALLRKLKRCLLPSGVFIIIEYDHAKASRWVPYPISFVQLKELFETEGYQQVARTGERKSIYQPGKMYVSLIRP